VIIPLPSPVDKLQRGRLNIPRFKFRPASTVRTRQRHDKNKLYALHAPEVECIGKGKARKLFEFGVKTAVLVSHQQGLMLSARTFPGNPYDGRILSAVLEQAANLTQDVGCTFKHVVADLGFRGTAVDGDNPRVQIIHRGRYKSLSEQERRWLKRQAVEPAIGHLKSDHRLDRCWLKGALGDALHAVSCATGYNLRWLLRAITRFGLGPAFLRLLQMVLWVVRPMDTSHSSRRAELASASIDDSSAAARPRRVSLALTFG
jgi:transposase, IS5 family